MSGTRAEQVVSVHRALLERWRVVMDLVGPGPLDPHFEDAAKAVGWLAGGDGGEGARWADLGSGAGFPGIALATALPHAEILLVERREKRAAFLEEVVAAAGLANTRVLVQDADTLPPGLDGLVSRAFRPPEQVLRLAARLLRPGGTCVLLLAREQVAERPGWSRFHVEPYEIGGHPRRVEGWRWSGTPPAGSPIPA